MRNLSIVANQIAMDDTEHLLFNAKRFTCLITHAVIDQVKWPSVRDLSSNR